MLRIALALCNLSAEKVEDGLGKLVMKGDITKLASKAKAGTAKECEQALAKAKQLLRMLDTSTVASSSSHDKFSADDGLLAIGQLFVRVGLYATEKGNLGRERLKHSLDDIKRLYLESLSKLVGYVSNRSLLSSGLKRVNACLLYTSDAADE